MSNRTAVRAGPDTVEKRARHQLDLKFDLRTGRSLRLAKKVKQLDKGRSMLLTLRPDGNPQLLVVGRGHVIPLSISSNRQPARLIHRTSPYENAFHVIRRGDRMQPNTGVADWHPFISSPV